MLGRFAIVALVCGLAYAWFTDEATLAETCAALLVGLVCALVAGRVDRGNPEDASVSPAFLGPLVRRVIPGVFRESFELIGPVLWRAVVQRKRVSGRWIEIRYDPRDQTPAREHARRSIVVFGSNLSPNALPLDVDVRRRRLILHQLVARHESAASDARYPM